MVLLCKYQNQERINELNDKLMKTEVQKAKLETKAKELETLKAKFDELFKELGEKQETLSQLLEKNGRMDMRISELERQLTETKQTLIQSDSLINELNHSKTEAMTKIEEGIKSRHDYENERVRREKAEAKIEELKEESKRLRAKSNKLAEEANTYKVENIELKSQMDAVKSKYDFISDKTHSEFEKNTALQDELVDSKKRLEIAENKSALMTQRFEFLLKKYDARKAKNKAKIERLWSYMQRERSKYKELLTNAQNELNSTKSFLEKESEYKLKNESSFQQMSEERARLVSL